MTETGPPPFVSICSKNVGPLPISSIVIMISFSQVCCCFMVNNFSTILQLGTFTILSIFTMESETPEERSCPLEETIKTFAGKWKPSILHYLADESCRFNALKRRIPGISQRMLTLQLRELEKDGLVIREHYPEIPPRVEYSVSPLGRTLEPIYLAIKEWEETHSDAIEKARQKYLAS